MPPKKHDEPERKPLIGRIGTNLRIGIVGVPNVGKSTFFNVLTQSAAPAENFPFCTIKPNENKYSPTHTLYIFIYIYIFTYIYLANYQANLRAVAISSIIVIISWNIIFMPAMQQWPPGATAAASNSKLLSRLDLLK